MPEAVTAGGADFEVEQRMALREVLAGVAALPGLQRQVMLSAAIEGHSHEEIAAELGLSDGAVRGLIYRARAALRTAAGALVPSPFVAWVARQGSFGGGSSSTIEALAGGGSAGMAGLLVKGAAMLAAAGAIATAAGVTANHLGKHATSHRAVVISAERAARVPHVARGHRRRPGTPVRSVSRWGPLPQRAAATTLRR